jgi:hypothetical protein
VLASATFGNTTQRQDIYICPITQVCRDLYNKYGYIASLFDKNFANVTTTCGLQIGLFLLIAAIQKEPRQVYERASAAVTARLRKYKANFIFTFTRVAYQYVK